MARVASPGKPNWRPGVLPACDGELPQQALRRGDCGSNYEPQHSPIFLSETEHHIVRIFA